MSSKPSRGNPNLSSIVITVLGLGLLVVLIWSVASALFDVTPDRPTQSVDVPSIVSQARSGAEYALVAPARLSSGWVANGARFDPIDHQAWHLGVLTEDGKYIGIDQQRRDRAYMLETFAGGSKAAGNQRIAGQTWQRRTTAAETIFVRTIGDSTVVVAGEAPAAVVEDYVASLSAG